MARKYYIPQNANKFSQFLTNLLKYVDQKASLWNHIPADRITALSNLNDQFTDLLASMQGQRTSAQNLERRELQAQATKELRGFVNQYLRFAPVTNVDRVEMGVPNHDTIPTTIPPPNIQAHGTLIFPGVGLVDIYDIKPDGARTDDRAKYGVRIYFGVISRTSKFRIAEPPKTGADLPHSVFTRRTRHRFDFIGEHGNTVYFCLRYENSKGQSGPWGKIISSFVP